MTTETRLKVCCCINYPRKKVAALVCLSPLIRTIHMIDTIELGPICKDIVLVSRAIIQVSDQVQFD